jgi:hypothetical protein
MEHILVAGVRIAQILILFIFLSDDVAFGQSRWIELELEDGKITYDLTTVQLLDPGRFTILSKNQENADVIQLDLKILETLKSYCDRPDGNYVPPKEVFVMGPPDMDIKKILVKTSPGVKPFKNVTWSIPYRRLALNVGSELREKFSFFDCMGPSVDSIDKEFQTMRYIIMNGIEARELYDCRHGIMGRFLNKDDPPSKAITTTNIRGVYLAAYIRLCIAVVGGIPYQPNNSSGD